MATTKTKRRLGNSPKKRAVKKTAVKKTNYCYLDEIAGILEKEANG